MARGYLERNAGTDRYRLGRSAARLGQAARGPFGLDRILPLLERLGASSGESVNLGMLDGDEIVVAMRAASQRTERALQSR